MAAADSIPPTNSPSAFHADDCVTPGRVTRTYANARMRLLRALPEQAWFHIADKSQLALPGTAAWSLGTIQRGLLGVRIDLYDHPRPKALPGDVVLLVINKLRMMDLVASIVN